MFNGKKNFASQENVFVLRVSPKKRKTLVAKRKKRRNKKTYDNAFIFEKKYKKLWLLF